MQPGHEDPGAGACEFAVVADLARLYDFLAPVNPHAAARALQSLTAAASRLLDQPRIGEKLEQYEPRESRRVLVGKYVPPLVPVRES